MGRNHGKPARRLAQFRAGCPNVARRVVIFHIVQFPFTARTSADGIDTPAQKAGCRVLTPLPSGRKQGPRIGRRVAAQQPAAGPTTADDVEVLAQRDLAAA